MQLVQAGLQAGVPSSSPGPALSLTGYMERFPLLGARFAGLEVYQWAGLALGLAFASLLAIVVGRVGSRIALRLTRATRVTWDDRLVSLAAGPVELLVGLSAFGAVERALALPAGIDGGLSAALRIAAVVVFTWIAMRALTFVTELAAEWAGRGGDPGQARARMTQLTVLKRIAGIALGFAAQRTIATLLAGIQLSFTQPIRVGDSLVLDGEFGTVEEITLTYVVVKVWDLRRLVVPITRFLDGSFQNWTRTGTQLLGTVLLRADYRLPVEALRQELLRFLATRLEWDREVARLHVTDASELTMEVRALVSAADAGAAFELRCAVREHLIGFLQELEGGRYLPRTRVEAERGGKRRELTP
jgi:tetrahydromethanopterin S-methyltransferase subunit F